MLTCSTIILPASELYINRTIQYYYFAFGFFCSILFVKLIPVVTCSFCSFIVTAICHQHFIV